MNKKFITLCVSALLAGGMATSVFASVMVPKTDPVAFKTYANWENVNPNFFYEIKINATNPGFDSSFDANYYANNYALKATYDTYGRTASKSEISGYSLWQFIPVKNENGILQGYKIVNAYGIPLAVSESKNALGQTVYELDRKGALVLFELDNAQIKVVGHNAYLAWSNTANNIVVTVPTNDGDPDNLSACVYEPASFANDALSLKSVFGDHFGLQIGYYDNGAYKQYENLQGNVFTGKLYPKGISDLSGSNIVRTLEPGEYFLMNEEGKFLVLLNDKWNVINTDLNGDQLKGYRFATMTAKELGDDLAKAQPTVKSYIFRIAGVNGHVKDVDAPLEVAVKMSKMDLQTSAYDENTWAELLVAAVKNEKNEISYYLTTAQAAEGTSSDVYDPINEIDNKPNAGDIYLDLNIADYTGDQKTYVKFGMNNFVSPTTFWGAAWNITKVEGDKTFNPYYKNLVDRREVGYSVPEGQWILREFNKKQAWINRETGKDLSAEFDFSKLRSTDEENVYSYEGVDYKITKAVELADADRFDYFGYDAKQTTAGVEQTYRIMFNSDLTGEPTYISIDGVGELHLTKDPTAAIKFHVDTMKTTDDAAVVNDLGLNANADVFDIVNKYYGKNDKGEWVEKEDTVSFYRYNLSYNGKYLYYDATNDKYVLNAPLYNNGKGGAAGTVDAQGKSHLMYKTPSAEHNVDAFVIKEKDGDILNVINLKNVSDFDQIRKDGTYADGSLYVDGTQKLFNSEMMYFDFNFAEARQETSIYEWVANAQLQLDYKDYALYRKIASTPDTVAIYRTEYSDEFLFEKGDFLGMTYDRDGYNAALFADTAYVRNNTEKPLFMLAVRPNITPAKTYCPDHGFNTDCPAQHLDTIPGYVDADYLTSLADSAAAYAKLLDNPYLDNGKYTKLAFVGARHNVDTVTVASTGKKFTITEGLVNPMLFAFRIVNQETQDFVIETADLAKNKEEFDAKENPYVVSYVRWNNGVPVLTKDITDAEVFNVKTDLKDANPTANEEITAEGSVVVAGTNGAVVVKGAEGKSVIVSTILGKVVANEVLTSDNATIAAPAGVVVVSVDGESFKVVVK